MAYAIGQCIVDNTSNATSVPANLITKDNFAEIIKEATELIGNPLFIPISNIDKFGVQAPPGEFISVNGEPIEIGRTGSYELLFNEVSIVSLKALSKSKFIIDYKYSL